MANIRKLWSCKNTLCKNPETGKHRGYKKVCLGEKHQPCKHCGVNMVLGDNHVTRITKGLKTHTRSISNKKVAVEYLAQCVTARRNGDMFPGEEVKVHWADAMEVFERDMEARLANGESKHTVRTYRCCAKQLGVTFGNRYLQDITRREVEAWRDNRKKINGNGSINKTLVVLGVIYNKVCDGIPEERARNLFVAHREIKKVKQLSKPKGRDNILENEEEFQVLLDNCLNPNLKHFVLCILNTGLRHGDVVMLKTSNIDFKRNEIVTVVKGNKTVRIPLTVSYKAFLEDHIAKLKISSLKGDYLFPSDSAAGHINITWDMGMKAACKRSAEHYKALGRPDVAKRFLALVPHDLRHSFATRFLYTMSKSSGATVAVHILSGILGHSSAWITERYCHVLDDNNQAAMVAYGSSMNLH